MFAGSLFKRSDQPRTGTTPAAFQLSETPRDASRPRLLCRSCGSAVTEDAQRIRIEGQHVHRRTNPAGIEFEFGCFAAAPGAESVGQPTTEFSWFAGYAWSYSVCRGCAAHLGWRFQGGAPSFHGLILARLVEAGSDRTLH